MSITRRSLENNGEYKHMKNLIAKVIKWHEDRNLIEGSTDKDQVLKLQQELGELSDSVCKQKDVKDDLGDMMVIMLNIMKRNNVTMERKFIISIFIKHFK